MYRATRGEDMKKEEKRPIPGTNPAWNRDLPDGYDNSLVDKSGNPYDIGWNFDERSDDEEDEGNPDNKTSWDELSEKA